MYGRTTKILYEKVLHWRRSTHISYTIRQFYVKSKEAGEVCRKILHTYIYVDIPISISSYLNGFTLLNAIYLFLKLLKLNSFKNCFSFTVENESRQENDEEKEQKKNMKNQMEKFFLSDVSWKENWRQLRRKKIYIL